MRALKIIRACVFLVAGAQIMVVSGHTDWPLGAFVLACGVYDICHYGQGGK